MSEEKVYVLKENGIADPSTVGLASFGIALFCLSFVMQVWWGQVPSV